MNHELDDLLLQRFVDGELSEQRQQDILAGLEDDPGQWRRVALAFVEAQIWEGEYRAVAEENRSAGKEQPVRDNPAKKIPREKSPRRASETGRGILVLVASLLLAWGIGLWQGGLWDSRPYAAAPMAGRTPSAPAIEPGSAEALESIAIPDEPEIQPPVLRLTLDDAQSGQLETVDFPLQEHAFYDAYPGRPLSVVGDDLRRILAASGYRVNQEQQIVPVRLSNGRRGVLPVNYVNLKYEGLGMYQ